MLPLITNVLCLPAFQQPNSFLSLEKYEIVVIQEKEKEKEKGKRKKENEEEKEKRKRKRETKMKREKQILTETIIVCIGVNIKL
ncbi:hypothetical protein M0813_02989 [Anaeramoeba flamelloides]|uniref:Uncharacterized protein n=1 Tax=Anaeramoeba flamelloides TaxID=1746091 RepID=A0ABQ8YEY2_9EUKA|nr:hypothetical protein M0813_02989 [Anaeramoeba flamelloides]